MIKFSNILKEIKITPHYSFINKFKSLKIGDKIEWKSINMFEFGEIISGVIIGKIEEDDSWKIVVRRFKYERSSEVEGIIFYPDITHISSNSLANMEFESIRVINNE